MFDSIKKGLEDAINDVNETTKLERHTVVYNTIKNHQTEAADMLTVRLIENEKE